MTQTKRTLLWLMGLMAVSHATFATPQSESDNTSATNPQTEPPKAEVTSESTQTESTQIESPPQNNEALQARVADLEAKVTALTEKAEEDELQKIIAEAESEADAPMEEASPEEREFLWGALALQKLNPEISVSADILATLIADGDGKFYSNEADRSRIAIREVGLQIQHVLDPYSMFKAAINFIPEPEPEVEVEEVYISWNGLIPSLSLTIGQFRQNFGVINRWHGHDLDQTDYPLALSSVLGDGGLCQAGFMIKWFMPPLIAHANELTLEVTNATNDTLYAGEAFSVPAVLMRLKNYYDLTDNTYLELGLSGSFGTNNKRGYLTSNGKLRDEPWRTTWVGGADLTINWSPMTRAKYRGVTWRTEGYFVRKETDDSADAVAFGFGEADGKRLSFGVFSYIDIKLSPRWIMGIRGDVALPTVRTKDTLAFDVVPYITFWQSEFVYLRLEYQHGQHIPYTRHDDTIGRRTDNRIMLQVDFAAGPHKHEKY